MRLIDRYFFRQLRASTILAASALTGIALLSQSLSALDLLVDQRQSAWIFAKVTLLATPQLLALILPIACLVAALATLNRLRADREFVICYSAGLSRWRVMAPFLRFSGWASLSIMILTLWAQPLCYRDMRQTLQEARADLAGSLIRPGQFNHPSPGLTVYAQSRSDDGGFENIFIHQQASRGRDNTLTARRGELHVRAGLPALILRDGANQSFDPSGKIDLLSFDEYVLDLRSLFGRGVNVEYKPSDRYLHELFFPDPRSRWAMDHRREFLAEGHARIAAPIYAVAFAVIALAAVLGGGQDQFGRGARLVFASAAALVDRTLGFAAGAAAASDPRLNILQYAAPLMAIAGGLWLLSRTEASARPSRLWRASAPPPSIA